MKNEDNFYIATKATFKGCKTPRREPDYISYSRTGRVSSMYWYSKKGVVRASDHWSLYRYLNDGRSRDNVKNSLKEIANNGRSVYYHDRMRYSNNTLNSSNFESKGCLNIASCFWILKSNNKHLDKITADWNNKEKIVLAGFCKWEHFKRNRI